MSDGSMESSLNCAFNAVRRIGGSKLVAEIGGSLPGAMGLSNSGRIAIKVSRT